MTSADNCIKMSNRQYSRSTRYSQFGVIKIFPFFFCYTDDDSFASERDVQPTDDQVTSFVFNQNHSSPIDAQREGLPIFKHREQILFCLENFQTLVLVGETGCGKSTQVPQVSNVSNNKFLSV